MLWKIKTKIRESSAYFSASFFHEKIGLEILAWNSIKHHKLLKPKAKRWFQIKN